MHLIKFPRADGTNAYVNPVMIRAVVASDKEFTRTVNIAIYCT